MINKLKKFNQFWKNIKKSLDQGIKPDISNLSKDEFKTN